ncbi:MAG: hypothetical protein U9Q74_04585 [Gemmatimonadota bacterium]|nr:hypothetical protein [Gemmatimonadota bacterium]
MPSFGLYLLAVFCPPAYFAVRHKWASFAINGLVYLVSFPLLLFFGVGLFTWMLSSVHAVWHVRAELIEHHATVIALKMKG